MVYVEDPKFTVKKYTLSKGESRKLKKVYQTVKWKSSNPKVAKVDQKGKVTARKKGNAVIKAYVGKNTVSCKIHVEEPKLSSKTEYILKGKSVKLKVTGTKRKVKWSSSNKDVTIVKNGKIKTKNWEKQP